MIIYLAGPEVFLPDALEIGFHKKSLCAERGHEGLFPLDNQAAARSGMASVLYRAKLALLHKADLVICNLTPVRGPSADATTIFELGYARGMGKPCLGYTNTPGTYLIRSVGLLDAVYVNGAYRDPEGLAIESYPGSTDILVVEESIHQSGAPTFVNRRGDGDLLRDLGAFKDCLDAIPHVLLDRVA